jgi:PAS domain-containing protein
MDNCGDIQRFVDKLSSVAAVLTTHDCAEPVILVANKLHETLSGYKNIDLIGRSPRVFQNSVFPSKEEKDNLRTALSTGDFWEGNLTNYKPDGSSYNLHIIILGVVINTNRYYLALKTLPKQEEGVGGRRKRR